MACNVRKHPDPSSGRGHSLNLFTSSTRRAVMGACFALAFSIGDAHLLWGLDDARRPIVSAEPAPAFLPEATASAAASDAAAPSQAAAFEAPRATSSDASGASLAA